MIEWCRDAHSAITWSGVIRLTLAGAAGGVSGDADPIVLGRSGDL
jgi:hypothetical protein